MYTTIIVSLAVYLIFKVAPRHGQTNILVYITICSSIGSLLVVACKGLSIAIKLTLSGSNQLMNPLFWMFLVMVIICIIINMNYLNKSLDIFNTSMVTPIYYVMFTTLTITATAILFKEWAKLTAVNILGIICGLTTTICGVFLLHVFKDVDFTLNNVLSLALSKRGGADSATDSTRIPLQRSQSMAIILDSSNTNDIGKVQHSSSWTGLVEHLDEEEVNTSETDTFLPMNDISIINNSSRTAEQIH